MGGDDAALDQEKTKRLQHLTKKRPAAPADHPPEVKLPVAVEEPKPKRAKNQRPFPVHERVATLRTLAEFDQTRWKGRLCEQVLNYTSSLYAGTIAFAVPFAVVLWVERMPSSLPAEVFAQPRAFLHFVAQSGPLSTVVMPFAGVAIMVDDWIGSRVSIAESGLLGQSPEYLPHRFLIDVAIAATGYAAIAAGTYGSSFWMLAFTGVFVLLGIVWLVYTRFGLQRAWRAVEDALQAEMDIQKLDETKRPDRLRKEVHEALGEKDRGATPDLSAAAESSRPLLEARKLLLDRALANTGVARVFSRGAISRVNFTIVDHIFCIITLFSLHWGLLRLKQPGGLLELDPDVEVYLGVYLIALIAWRRYVFSRLWENLFKRLLRI